MRSKTQLAVADAFGVSAPKGQTVLGFSEPGPMTPAVDPNYRFRRSLLSDVLSWHAMGNRSDPMWINGPTGSGKSSLVTQVAARLNIEVEFVGCHEDLELGDLYGMKELIAGETIFVDGPLTRAARHGRWAVLEEADTVKPGVSVGLNMPAEGRPLVIADNGGEVVDIHPEFRLIVCANTSGVTDFAGDYAGTQSQNLAYLDRYWPLTVDYPLPEDEREILQAGVPGLPGAIVDTLIAVANRVRDAYVGRVSADGGPAGPRLSAPMSTRTIIRWAKLVQFHWAAWQVKDKDGKHLINPFTHAIDRAFAMRLPAEEREAVRELVQRYCGDDPAALGGAT